jgi:hypothetical protein
MNKYSVLLLALSYTGTNAPAQDLQAQKVRPEASANHHETFNAIVEKVYRTEDEGCVSMAYQVTWKGHQIIVEDPTHKTDFTVGDNLKGLAMWQYLRTVKGVKKLLGFVVL